MKLLFKQRFFSWLCSYDIYDENGNTVYTVKGQLSWGHKLNVYDAPGNHIATLQEKLFSFLPRFEIYIGGELAGTVKKEFSFFKPRFIVDYKGWEIEGDFLEWEYTIYDFDRHYVAHVTKELFNLTDTYTINVGSPEDALPALMLVLAIDAEKCSRND